MKCILQRVLEASVSVNGQVIGQIKKGYVVLLGIEAGDTAVEQSKLLKKILDNGVIDSLTYNLAIIEPIPVKPNPIPRKAPHLVEKLAKEKTGKRLTSTLDYGLQNQVNRIVANYYKSVN